MVVPRVRGVAKSPVYQLRVQFQAQQELFSSILFQESHMIGGEFRP